MGMVTRIALPGYNAKTDTNLDHYSLYSDVDNVLIKRLATGNPTITDGSPTDDIIAHNLTYIPFFMVYVDNASNGIWSIVNNQFNAFSVPQQICGIDTSNLHIQNYGGHAAGNAPFAYDIFYDNMSNSIAPAITDSHAVYKVARPSKSATSTNPNDYIMHSDLNNFKILKQGTITINVTAGFNSYSFAHGFTGTTPYKFFCYIKVNGTTMLLGNASQYSYDELNKFIVSTMDATNINISGTWGSNQTISVYYLIYGTGTNGILTNTAPLLKIAKSGSNAKTSTNPDDYTFHSNYPTLKYYLSGSYDMGSISSGTEYSFAHNLGYVPFFVGFVNDLEGFIPNAYAIMPYFTSHSSLATPKRNVGCWIYADSTNIYLKAWYDVNMTTAFHPIFYYKIFKNNLGL